MTPDPASFSLNGALPMTSTSQGAPLSQEELDALETLLGSDAFHDDAMPLDALQGLFFALAAAPDPVLPSRWLPVALGEDPHTELSLLF